MGSKPLHQRSPTRGWLAVALSLAVHVLIVAIAATVVGAPRSRPLLEQTVFELADVPPPPEEEEREPPPVTQPEPEKAEPTPRPRRPRARPDNRLAALVQRPTPATQVPDIPQPVVEPEQPAPTTDEPSPHLAPNTSLHRLIATELVQLGEEGQNRLKVKHRVEGMLRGALPPRINDQPTFPELLPDAEGNLTWYRHGLRATILPDGSVEWDMPYRVSLGEYGAGSRRCAGPSAGPGQCKAVAAIPTRAGEITPSHDMNDLILRAKGEDPRAAVKRWFLRQTKELRDSMAERHRKRALWHTPSRVQGNAARTWTNASLSAAERRRQLFQLWDECEERQGETDDRPEAAAGREARSQIIRFVRRRLPSGSPDGFTAAELEQLNAGRRSRERFQPY